MQTTMQTAKTAVTTKNPDQTFPNRTMMAAAVRLKVPNAKITISRNSDFAIADGAIGALFFKFKLPPLFRLKGFHCHCGFEPPRVHGPKMFEGSFYGGIVLISIATRYSRHVASRSRANLQ